MNAREFANTSSNMAQAVRNIVEAYKMGAMRALAQEPVQNALDALRPGKKTVEVEYRLLQRRTSAGETCFLLTVTDTGATGLRGPIVNAEQLEARNFKLRSDENWAAFEAQGYTKENEDALGSRGQGKAAFLYHSHVPGQTRRMLMLYDTLLENGEYRLGMRYVRPVDQVLMPPLYNEEARSALAQDFYFHGDLAVPLGLEALREVGTRVIVPFLAEEDAAELRPGGELERWLQRCWWRAIQTRKLRIRVVDDATDSATDISVPSWWKNFPRQQGKHAASGSWVNLPDGGRACTWGDVEVGAEYRIRRLVMQHSDALDADEIILGHVHPEYAGIQLLRGSQWIETSGALIPKDKEPGFRAYVEFDKHTDSALRAAENSQHDGFDGRKQIVQKIREVLREKVREFSEAMGWETAQPLTNERVSQREKQTHIRFLKTFLNANGRKPKPGRGKEKPEFPQLRWRCRLDLDYPDPKSARVNWGQAMQNVYVTVGFEPGEDLIGSADLILEWVDAAGKTQEIYRSEDAIRKQWVEDRVQQQFELENWQILRGKAGRERQIECPDPGECKLRAVVMHGGERVTSAARAVYVEKEPPPPPQQKAVALSISAINDSDGEQVRIDHGQVLNIDIFAKNRSTESATYFLTASFENELFARQEPLELTGTPAGDTARKQLILTEKRQLLDPQQARPLMMAAIQQLKMPDSSGVYRVRAELTDANGESVAVASRPVYFERDPGAARNSLPFEIGQEQQKEMWKMNADLTRLTYSRDYPLYKELRAPKRQNRALQANLAFIAEISANGLLEWALRPKDDGDDSNFDQLHDESRDLNDPLWDEFNRGLLNMSYKLDSSFEFAQTWRETVATMLDIFAQEND